MAGLDPAAPGGSDAETHLAVQGEALWQSLSMLTVTPAAMAARAFAVQVEVRRRAIDLERGAGFRRGGVDRGKSRS